MNGDETSGADEIGRLRELLGLVRHLGRLGLWERDRVTGEGRWDPEVFRLYGLPPADRSPPIHESMSRIHPDDRERAASAFADSLARPGRHDVRYRVRRGDGQVTWIHSVWQVPVQGTRIVGVLIDDSETAAVATQHALAQSQLELVSEVAGIGLWTFDPATGRQQWSAPMLALHGLTSDAEMPATAEDRISTAVLPEDRAMLAEKMRDMLGPGAPGAEARWRIRRTDGSVRTLFGRARRVAAANGQIVGVAMDISELQAAEQARRERDAAEQASRTKSEFLSRMSHELRTPLNAVLGFAELLLIDLEEPAGVRQRERLHRLHEAGRELLALVDEVLDIAGRRGATVTTTDVNGALDVLASRSTATSYGGGASGRPRPGLHHELVYVEDNPVNRLLVEQVVAQRPHLRLHCADSVREGEALIRRVRPALALVDLHLPDGDGYELLALLRSGADPVDVPCVMLSADAQPQQLERAMDAGFEAYWTKPIDVSALLGELDRRLSA